MANVFSTQFLTDIIQSLLEFGRSYYQHRRLSTVHGLAGLHISQLLVASAAKPKGLSSPGHRVEEQQTRQAAFLRNPH